MGSQPPARRAARRKRDGEKKSDFLKSGVDLTGEHLLSCVSSMGQQLKKRLKRQRRDARKKRVQARLRAGMKK